MSFHAEALAAIEAALLLTGGEEDDLSDLVTGTFSLRPLVVAGTRRVEAAFGVGGAMLVNVVVPEPPLEPHAQADQVPDAADAMLTVWLHGSDTDEDRAAVARLRDFVRSLLADGLLPNGEEGALGFPQWIGDLPVRDNGEEYRGSIVANVQFRVSHQWLRRAVA